MLMSYVHLSLLYTYVCSQGGSLLQLNAFPAADEDADEDDDSANEAEDEEQAEDAEVRTAAFPSMSRICTHHYHTVHAGKGGRTRSRWWQRVSILSRVTLVHICIMKYYLNTFVSVGNVHGRCSPLARHAGTGTLTLRF